MNNLTDSPPSFCVIVQLSKPIWKSNILHKDYTIPITMQNPNLPYRGPNRKKK